MTELSRPGYSLGQSIFLAGRCVSRHGRQQALPVGEVGQLRSLFTRPDRIAAHEALVSSHRAEILAAI